MALPPPAFSSDRRFGDTELRPPGASAGLIFGSVALNLLGLALPLVILQVYDRVLPNQTGATLAVLMAGLAVVLLMDGMLRLGRGALSHFDAARWEHRAGCAAVGRMLSADLAAVEADARGRHLDRLGAIEALRDYYGGQGRLAALDLPFVALYLGLIALIGGTLVLIPVGVLLLLAATSLLAGRRLKRALARRAELDDRRYSFAIEALVGIRTIKALAAEPFMLRRYERLQQAAAEATHATVLWSNLAQASGALFTAAMLVAIVSVGALQVMAGGLTLGGLAAATLLAGRAAQPVLRALGLWTQLQSLGLARRRLDEITALDLGPASLDRAPDGQRDDLRDGLAHGAGDASISGAVRAAGVRYRGSGDRMLLDGLNLTVEAGEMVAISGASGSGKSTLLALLAGDLTPEAGVVSFDGRTVGMAGRAVRRQIAVVPQTARLLNGTLLENLTFFEEAEAVDRALEAAAAVGLDDDVHRLPAGWDTRVGEGVADDLPASLRQKVAIARALGRRPRILMLDESNSALDGPADARLRRALAELRGATTVLMVTLRPSFQRLADRHLVLEGGRLAPAAARPAATAVATAAATASPPAAPAPAALRPTGSGR